MKRNRGVSFVRPGQVEVREIEYPKMEIKGKAIEHGVILKIVLGGICGTDLHMYRGRVPSRPGSIWGHEITGQVIELGKDVEFVKEGDIVSVSCNVACGCCDNCKEEKFGLCLTTGGAAYGYDMSEYQGGQAEYIMVPYADFNLLKLPDQILSSDKIKDLALISDIFPTGFHGAYSTNVTIGSKVYIAGAGPVGLSCALSCKLLGAAKIIIGDVNKERLKLAQSNGYITIDLSKTDNLPKEIEKILGKPEVDIFIDCVGFEAFGYGSKSHEGQPTRVIDSAIEITKVGGYISLVGLYNNIDLLGKNENEKHGIYNLDLGQFWIKALTLVSGVAPSIKYKRELMEVILSNRCNIAKEVNVKIISLDEAPEAYKKFSQGEPVKYLIDPHGLIS